MLYPTPNTRLERTRHEAGFFVTLLGRAAEAQRLVAVSGHTNDSHEC